MKERPILFSGEMARALLAGTKTQTRRIVKPVGNDDGFVLQDYGDGWWPYRSDDGETPFKGENEIPHACPYGAPGDRLWVRETWRALARFNACPVAIGSMVTFDADAASGDERPAPLGRMGRGRPSIHMPRWASRITLEITAVRVERLQDISRGDAMAEGCPFPNMAQGDDPCQWYRGLWEQINGVGSWDANPWVWVVSFEIVQP